MSNLQNDENQKKKFLEPGERISPEILEQLTKANADLASLKSHETYLKTIENIFGLENMNHLDDSTILSYISGFFEGDGSVNVGLTRDSRNKLGVEIMPEFKLTQNMNRVDILYLALRYLKCGTIFLKSGTNSVLELRVKKSEDLFGKVIPFLDSFLCKYGSAYIQNRIFYFKKLLILRRDGVHLELDGMLYQCLPIWDILRIQRNQANQAFKDLEDAQNYVRNFYENNSKKKRKR